MDNFEGRVEEIQLDHQGFGATRIICPKDVIPSPGQYVLAHSPHDPDAPLGKTLFASETSDEGFLSVPPVPRSWEPGTRLLLRGRLGHGFNPPKDTQRLGIIALDNTLSYLLPLATQGLRVGSSVAIYADGPLPALPSDLEVHPLSAAHEAPRWADFLGICLYLESLPGLRDRMQLDPGDQIACPAQALILAPMPCNGLAECGVCGVPARRGWKMTCKDGPVFPLASIDW
jgi:hypothetical protein